MTKRIIRRIADLAHTMEPDREVVYQWIIGQRLPELDGRTTFELALDGEADHVLRLLQRLGREGRTRLPMGTVSA